MNALPFIAEYSVDEELNRVEHVILIVRALTFYCAEKLVYQAPLVVSANNDKTTFTIDNCCFTTLEYIWSSHNVCQSSYKYRKLFSPFCGSEVVKLL